MDVSLSGRNRRSAAGHICKIALRTIPRCGIAALILLCMGFYFLFPACQTFQQIQAEKHTPYELTATTDSAGIDLGTLMEIEGVERISPVMDLSATLSLNDSTMNCEIRAVYSSFLHLNFTDGTMYPDSSNMPYLILNKAAVKTLDPAMTISPDDTIMMRVNGTERKAIICGIFDDEKETPTVYMSYDIAQRVYGTNRQTELVILLSNMGSAENAVSALQRQNIYAGFDSNLTLAWELLQKQGWQNALLSIGLLACAVALIREKRSVERIKAHSETTMLLVCGMTANEISGIFALRIFLANLLCILTALSVAACMKCLTVLGIVASICCSGIVLCAILIKEKPTVCNDAN